MPQENRDRKPISLFYSYSHKDEDLRLKLQEHLAALRWSGKIAEWHDREIEAGKEWEEEIDHHLSSADIILLLVSASFIASRVLLERRDQKGAGTARARRGAGDPGDPEAMSMAEHSLRQVSGDTQGCETGYRVARFGHRVS
jgi:hypothetical protein